MAKIGEFKGRSTIVLNPGEEYEVSFGMSKAKLILANIDNIREFVESDGRRCEPLGIQKQGEPQPKQELPF